MTTPGHSTEVPGPPGPQSAPWVRHRAGAQQGKVVSQWAWTCLRGAGQQIGLRHLGWAFVCAALHTQGTRGRRPSDPKHSLLAHVGVRVSQGQGLEVVAR